MKTLTLLLLVLVTYGVAVNGKGAGRSSGGSRSGGSKSTGSSHIPTSFSPKTSSNQNPSRSGLPTSFNKNPSNSQPSTSLTQNPSRPGLPTSFNKNPSNSQPSTSHTQNPSFSSPIGWKFTNSGQKVSEPLSSKLGGSYHTAPAPRPQYAPNYYHKAPTQAFVPGHTNIVINNFQSHGGSSPNTFNDLVSAYAVYSMFHSHHDNHHVHHYPRAPSHSTTTQIVNNNYYYGNTNNGSQNKNIQANLTIWSPEIEKIDPFSDLNIMKLTEELFEAADKNLYPFVELNIQKNNLLDKYSNGKVLDQAPQRLFVLKNESHYNTPTVIALRALYDSYERNGTKLETARFLRKFKEETFVNEIMKTPVMKKAMNWLVNQSYVKPSEFDRRQTLTDMWFSVYNTSSGFERIFLSEIYGSSGLFGMQNWLYFAHLESQNKVNYLGFVDNKPLGWRGQLLKLNYETEGITMQDATILVGTTPELEMALYTICFYTRPNNWCPVSLGGAKFFVMTDFFKQDNKDVMDFGFPAF